MLHYDAYLPAIPPETVAIPAGPGGAWDSLSRAIQRSVTEGKLVNKNVIVSNKPGGGGAVGWTYLKGKEGNAHFLAANSSLVLLNNLLGSSPLSFNDFTPLAMLTTEWISVAVKADSPYKTGKDLLEQLKKDPGSLTIGVGPSLGNNDHLPFIRIAQKAGVDVTKLKWVVIRYTMDIEILQDGVDFLVCIIGAYAISEVFNGYADMDTVYEIDTKKIGRVMITKEDWDRTWLPIVRSTPVAFFLGCLPGIGGSMTSLIAYTTERQLSKSPENFGKGDIVGVAARWTFFLGGAGYPPAETICNQSALPRNRLQWPLAENDGIRKAGRWGLPLNDQLDKGASP